MIEFFGCTTILALFLFWVEHRLSESTISLIESYRESVEMSDGLIDQYEKTSKVNNSLIQTQRKYIGSLKETIKYWEGKATDEH